MGDLIGSLAAKLRFHEPLDESGILGVSAALVFRLYVLAEEKVCEFGNGRCGSSDGLLRCRVLTAGNQPQQALGLAPGKVGCPG